MGPPPRRLLHAFLLELIQRLRVVAQAQTEGKADGVHHEVGEFVVPRLLHEFERQVESSTSHPTERARKTHQLVSK